VLRCGQSCQEAAGPSLWLADDPAGAKAFAFNH
jgi:hypothetical protein